MKTGDIVKYKNPTDSEDAACVFVVTESHADVGRAHIKLIDDSFALPPVEVVAFSELVIA